VCVFGAEVELWCLFRVGLVLWHVCFELQ